MAGKGSMREGDWICPDCGNHNFASRVVCNKCSAPKPGGAAQMHGQPQMMTPMMMQQQQPMPGGGNIQNFRPGDWMCPACNNHNYQSKTSCNRCGAPKPPDAGGAPMMGYGPAKGGGKGAGMMSPYGAPMIHPMEMQMQMQGMAPGGKGFGKACGKDMRPGDWMCSSCGNHNYASRTKCGKCQRPKDAPAGFREGDWMCPSCGNHNYASRAQCGKCQEPKPEAADADVFKLVV